MSTETVGTKKPKLSLRDLLNKSTQVKTKAERTWNITQLTADGKKTVKKVTAPTRSRAKTMADPELELVSITEAKSLLQMEFGTSVKGSVLLQFTRQLASFTAAGIPVLEALTMLAQSSKSAPMRAAIEAMVDDVRDGGTLAAAAAEHKHVFPPYYIAILGAAERTGDLSGTFETISVYLERDLNSSRAVKSAMYYPAVLTLLGVGAMVVMSTVVLPKFRTFFTSLDTELPPATAALLAITDFIGNYWVALVGSIVALIAFFVYYRRTPAGHLETDKLVLKAPVFGQLLQLVALERFCRILASLNDTGVNLTDSLKLSAEVLGNKAYEQAVLRARDGVIAGEGFAAPLANAKLFPEEAVQIFRVGEQSGLLSLQLKHAANYYAGEVDYRLKNLTALIEPMVLLVIGGGTGFVAVALVSAMYGIYSSQSMGG